MLADMPHLRADNHPHNFYLQLLAIQHCWNYHRYIFHGVHYMDLLHGAFQEPGNIVVTTAFIVPWECSGLSQQRQISLVRNNIFIWYGVALALAASSLQLKRKIIK